MLSMTKNQKGWLRSLVSNPGIGWLVGAWSKWTEGRIFGEKLPIYEHLGANDGVHVSQYLSIAKSAHFLFSYLFQSLCYITSLLFIFSFFSYKNLLKFIGGLTFRSSLIVWCPFSTGKCFVRATLIHQWSLRFKVFWFITYCGARILGSYFGKDFFPIGPCKVSPHLYQTIISTLITRINKYHHYYINQMQDNILLFVSLDFLSLLLLLLYSNIALCYQ